MFRIDSQIQDDTATLALAGQFDYNAYAEFKSCEEAIFETQGVRQIVVDLNKLDYLDSSALGILLLLRERAQEHNVEVVLRAAQGVAREIIDIAHFERMFRFVD